MTPTRALLAVAVAACTSGVAAQEEPPRPVRTGGDETIAKTLQLLARFDRHRDGRVERGEWNGAPGAFERLDLDRDGVLDKKDRKLAESRVEGKGTGSYDELEVETPLPDPESLLRRYDKNGDRMLSRAEVKGAPFAHLFALADLDHDSMLDPDEVAAMVREVAMRVSRRVMGYLPQRPFEVPFSTWDKNKDGRLEVSEWLGNQNLFARLDVNRDGAVTKEEVVRYERSVKGRDFVEKFDLDGDGKVTLAEFGGPRDAFLRADRNGDGAVTRADR